MSAGAAAAAAAAGAAASDGGEDEPGLLAVPRNTFADAFRELLDADEPAAAALVRSLDIPASQRAGEAGTACEALLRWASPAARAAAEAAGKSVAEMPLTAEQWRSLRLALPRHYGAGVAAEMEEAARWLASPRCRDARERSVSLAAVCRLVARATTPNEVLQFLGELVGDDAPADVLTLQAGDGRAEVTLVGVRLSLGQVLAVAWVQEGDDDGAWRPSDLMAEPGDPTRAVDGVRSLLDVAADAPLKGMFAAARRQKMIHTMEAAPGTDSISAVVEKNVAKWLGPMPGESDVKVSPRDRRVRVRTRLVGDDEEQRQHLVPPCTAVLFQLADGERRPWRSTTLSARFMHPRWGCVVVSVAAPAPGKADHTLGDWTRLLASDRARDDVVEHVRVAVLGSDIAGKHTFIAGLRRNAVLPNEVGFHQLQRLSSSSGLGSSGDVFADAGAAAAVAGAGAGAGGAAGAAALSSSRASLLASSGGGGSLGRSSGMTVQQTHASAHLDVDAFSQTLGAHLLGLETPLQLSLTVAFGLDPSAARTRAGLLPRLLHGLHPGVSLDDATDPTDLPSPRSTPDPLERVYGFVLVYSALELITRTDKKGWISGYTIEHELDNDRIEQAVAERKKLQRRVAEVEERHPSSPVVPSSAHARSLDVSERRVAIVVTGFDLIESELSQRSDAATVAARLRAQLRDALGDGPFALGQMTCEHSARDVKLVRDRKIPLSEIPCKLGNDHCAHRYTARTVADFRGLVRTVARH